MQFLVFTFFYLGDILNNQMPNKENIDNRLSRGIGIVTQIMTILEKVSLGEYFFEMAILLRESLLLSSMLSSAEIWYNLKPKEVKALENVDLQLLSNICQQKSSTPQEG